MNGFAPSPSTAYSPPSASAAAMLDHQQHQPGFFTSNSAPPPPPPPPPSTAQQAFLPPLQPAPAARAGGPGGGGAGAGGATFLSDEETQSDSGGGSTPASSSATPAAGAGQGAGQGAGGLFAHLPPLAPAPTPGALASTSAAATPGKARASSRTPAPALDAGAGAPVSAKGKGKAKADGEPKKKGGAGGGGGGKKRGQQLGADGKPLPKKKKAGRACAACQKAHLTCDDSRPCARCVKKGCPEECIDGARKKAKYLQEIPDELLHRHGAPPTTGAPPAGGLPSAAPSDTLGLLQPDLSPSSAAQPQPFFDFSATVASSSAPGGSAAAYDPSSFLSFPPSTTTATTSIADPSGPSPLTSTSALPPGAGGGGGGLGAFDDLPLNLDLTLGLDTSSGAAAFGSEAANLEYAILSSMLNGNGFALDVPTPAGGPGPSGLTGLGGMGGLGGGVGGAGMKSTADGESMLLDPSGSGANGASLPQGGAGGANGTTPGSAPGGGGGGEYGESPASAVQGGSGAGAGGGGSGVAGLLTAEEAYRSVTKPYPYAQSYHYLVKHLKERFEKNDILRIIRALATFRPSLIALQMPLTEEDETFVERTFQRTLVELNKLISFSGTPTVVWRRTGEICLVGTEFCLLTGWKREELVGKKYIFELFDTASVVEYYESFAKHAFESTATSITMQCVVLGPDGRPVPCAFCFSVRRDLFSCPFLVIGSFLPILV
ncbi:hypothetical protein JCM8097_004675 [Rhodosporidiobolus ruineniae]